MARRIGMLLIVVIAIVSLLGMANSQTGQGGKKTITLPNGNVIWDLNGEWDVINENYGAWSRWGVYPNIHRITQTGSSIVGVLAMDDRYYKAGYQYIGAELDKTGFLKVKIYTNFGTLDSKGWVSEDGNKIVIDDGEKFKMTLTRK